jgi:hypothetical protein
MTKIATEEIARVFETYRIAAERTDRQDFASAQLSFPI